MEKIKRVQSRIIAAMQSAKFFYAVIFIFVIEAVWIALSGQFSMPFDENTHLDTIQLYSERILPFWASNPEGVGNLGGVARDPSYLYHYLMSFPYRLFASFVSGEMAQVIFLRFLNIGMFVAGLFVFKNLILRATSSKAITHTVMLLFVLTPYVPFLAAQINYDNAIFPLAGLSFMLLLKIAEDFKQRSRVDVGRLAILMSIGSLASLVKYPFLLIFFGIFICLVALVYRHVKEHGWRSVRSQASKSFSKLSTPLKLGMAMLVIVSLGLFFERFGVNTIKYGTPTPECNQVLSVEECKSYGPWARNYEARQDKLSGAVVPEHTDPLNYTVRHWARIMSYQLFFAYNGQIEHFEIGAPLILPLAVGMIIAVVGAVFIIHDLKGIRQKFKLNMLMFISLLYVVGLWTQEYMDFYHLGVAVAIQARYLMPVLPIIYMIVALAYVRKLDTMPNLKLPLATAVIAVLMFQGGGATVFIVRSNPDWWWENSAVININQGAQSVLKKFVVGAHKAPI